MVQDYVEKIMRNGIINFAQKSGKKIDEVQLLILWDENENKPKYKKLELGESSTLVTFNEILNVKFDMLNRESLVGHFIAKTLNLFSKERECKMSELFVLIALNEETDELNLFLYQNRNKIQVLDLEKLLT